MLEVVLDELEAGRLVADDEDPSDVAITAIRHPSVCPLPSMIWVEREPLWEAITRFRSSGLGAVADMLAGAEGRVGLRIVIIEEGQPARLYLAGQHAPRGAS